VEKGDDMKIFDASEILKIAIKIEEKGEAFYTYASRITKDEKISKIFQFLAEAEVKHRIAFEKMSSTLDEFTPPEAYPGEYQAYLAAYLDNVIFPKENWDEIFADMKDVFSTINFGIRIELDSILFYHEGKRFVSKFHQETIDHIIEEERQHFLKLLDIKKMERSRV